MVFASEPAVNKNKQKLNVLTSKSTVEDLLVFVIPLFVTALSHRMCCFTFSCTCVLVVSKRFGCSCEVTVVC